MGKTPAQEMARKLTATKKLMAEEKKKNHVKDDFAFGLKNQKGAKQKLNVDKLRAEAAKAGRSKAQILADEKKKEEQRERSRLKKLGYTEEELLLGRKVVVTKGMKPLAAGVDPKSVLCGYFKAGKCKQGNKCKFSHDLDIERTIKSKRSLYTDEREREKDTMDLWDQEKLEAVISQKRNNPNATQIVCNYFIEAIETRKYGWFWKCDNGDHCLYQHKLPPGFVLKSDMPVEAEMAEEDICEHIERERAKLDHSKGTPVTPENFAAWKETQKKRKLEEMKKEMEEAKKGTKSKSKQHRSGMTGRALFTFRPQMFKDDDDAAGDDDYEYEVEEPAEGEVKDDTTAKDWAAEEKEMDEAEFLAALTLQEKSAEDGEGADAADGGEAAAAPTSEEAAEDSKPAGEPTAEDLEAIKKAKKEERARKAEEKKKAKLAAKLAKNAKPLTAFQLAQIKEAETLAEEQRIRKANEN